MRHATDAALDRLEDLLRQVRGRHPELRERKRGAFYRGGQGWLHFHEDPAGLFADVKVAGAWSRLPVNNTAEVKLLLDRLALTLTRQRCGTEKRRSSVARDQGGEANGDQFLGLRAP